MSDPPRSGLSRPVRVREVTPNGRADREDEAAVEEPLEIRVARGGADAEPVAVTMRTPGHDFELAAGFLRSEGVVRGREDIQRISYCTGPEVEQQFNVVNVILGAHVPFDAEGLRRNVYTSSSCGICGKAVLDRVRAAIATPPAGSFAVDPSTLGDLPDRLRASQRGFDRTGGLHASGLFTPDGKLLAVREDVGRHNALDKLVGYRLLDGHLPDSGTIVLVSGRACFELVQKAALAGVPMLAAVGAPTTLAIELAAEQGMTLVGFLRPGRFNVYCGDQRVSSVTPG
jgi:FdhD protein